jgi:hypothetical protein
MDDLSSIHSSSTRSARTRALQKAKLQAEIAEMDRVERMAAERRLAVAKMEQAVAEEEIQRRRRLHEMRSKLLETDGDMTDTDISEGESDGDREHSQGDDNLDDNDEVETKEPDAEHRDSFDRLAAEVEQTIADLQQKLQKQPADNPEEDVPLPTQTEVDPNAPIVDGQINNLFTWFRQQQERQDKEDDERLMKRLLERKEAKQHHHQPKVTPQPPPRQGDGDGDDKDEKEALDSNAKQGPTPKPRKTKTSKETSPPEVRSTATDMEKMMKAITDAFIKVGTPHAQPPSAQVDRFIIRQSHKTDLPLFNGKPEDWPVFIATFHRSTKTCGFNDEENLMRLQRCLRGEAEKAVKCLLVSPNNLQEILSTLETRFGKTQHIIDALVVKMMAIPPVRADRLETIVE